MIVRRLHINVSAPILSIIFLKFVFIIGIILKHRRIIQMDIIVKNIPLLQAILKHLKPISSFASVLDNTTLHTANRDINVTISVRKGDKFVSIGDAIPEMMLAKPGMINSKKFTFDNDNSFFLHINTFFHVIYFYY